MCWICRDYVAGRRTANDGAVESLLCWQDRVEPSLWRPEIEYLCPHVTPDKAA